MNRETDVARIGLAVASALKSRREGLKMSKNGLAQKAGINPLFPALRSGHRLFQRPSPEKQIPSSTNGTTGA
jgi:hypothetical protein